MKDKNVFKDFDLGKELLQSLQEAVAFEKRK